ncbi:MAG: FAD-dependent oxidoreductase [Spirochaetia bacterium]|nr:FAD-dependent oxidoreductase [Spirochaetia bacterium]
MKKLAIIGSGIAGMASAYYLRDAYDIYVFEKDSRVGGHTNTIQLDDPAGPISIDTGFIVHNPNNYPSFVKLIQDLGVETIASDMSFSVYNRNINLQFAGENLGSLFAQRRNIFSPRHLGLLLQANRFNKLAPRHAISGKADVSLGEYLSENGYNEHFMQNFIFPMASAVWSTPRSRINEFHAESFIRFFMNHGFLGLSGGREWRTIAGGSSEYMRKIQAALKNPVRTSTPVHRVKRQGDGVVVQTGNGEATFDKVILATHADQALKLLSDASDLEHATLREFQYSKNIATLHSDSRVMPPLKRIWASWNYKIEHHAEEASSCTIYYMNRLQRLQTKTPYFVSINEIDSLDPEKVFAQIEYDHPIFNKETAAKQKTLSRLNEQGPVYFAGSYFGFGFHEDALASALNVVRALS